MEIILVAVVALVLLSAVDTQVWPARVMAKRSSRAHRPARRGLKWRTRRASPQFGSLFSLVLPRRRALSGARWWWE